MFELLLYCDLVVLKITLEGRNFRVEHFAALLLDEKCMIQKESLFTVISLMCLEKIKIRCSKVLGI